MTAIIDALALLATLRLLRHVWQIWNTEQRFLVTIRGPK